MSPMPLASSSLRRRCAGMSFTPLLCLIVTIGATLYALKSAPQISFRKAPEFIRFHNVERALRGIVTTIGTERNFVSLIGVVVATVVVGVAMMRTVKGIDDAGWLNFIPACAVVLTVAAGVILAIFAAGLRIQFVPTPENAHVDMAFHLMTICVGVLSAVAGKLST